MPLTNVALTPEEAKEMTSPVEASGDISKYPYGLRLCLNKETLEKLGLPTLPVGTKVTVMAEGSVVSVSEHQEMDGDSCKSLDIQIEMMAVEQKSNGVDDVASRLYPNMQK